MDHRVILLLLLFAFAVVFAGWITRRLKVGSSGNIEGKLIWQDLGRSTKVLVNSTFGVKGKPDSIYKIPGGAKAVEYKHRKGKVFDSDIAQALASSLAARGAGYRIIEVLVLTRTERLSIDLRCSDQTLYEQIQGNVKIVRAARRGKRMRAYASRRKCLACAYRDNCDSVRL